MNVPVVERISQQQLESYLWGAAVLLRGTIDAGDYKQFIFPLLFYKRLCDVFDEETQSALVESGGDKAFASYAENHRFQIPPEAHWREVRKMAKDVGRVLQNAMRAIETANPDKLYGIFGDAQWTNKDRLSDAMLRDLVEHFSTLELTLANLPEDELGNGYEYLIKKFADDSGHTAAEFYTNRTVVHLMTEMLKPQPGETIYDPTCGSGGMLLSCITHLRRQRKEWRNVRLYGQERNLMTSSIARMNCFLHGIEDFRIERGDTLAEPKLVQGDRLMHFDVVLANPPYSIKQWDRDAFASDPWGRNLYGTPPQGRADYAFWQHILQSMAPKTGRCAILFPHGVLFRQEEADMRRKLIEADVIECVLGLGPNLFYNSPMEACVVICRTAKPKERRNKILFINAVNEVTRERAQSFLTDDHIERIVRAYEQFKDEPGFTRVATLEEIRAKEGSLNIPVYVSALNSNGQVQVSANGTLPDSLSVWLSSVSDVRTALTTILDAHTLKEVRALCGKPAQTPPAWIKRDKWKRLPFGEFGQSVNERIEPSKAGEEIYVGLEHLDSQDLHIRRCGKGSDVIGTKLRFRRGDLIFGRRRAYQHKLAVAEMDGICSAHAMVVRAKPDTVLPEFLPFLMMSDRFMNRAVEISVGSLSPTINWATLKLEEFVLPPLDQQRRIAEILWAVDAVEQTQRSITATATDYLRAVVESELDGLFTGHSQKLSDLWPASPDSGCSAHPSTVQTGHYVLSLTALSDAGYVRGNLKPVEATPVMLSARLSKGDLLISRSNTQELVGLVGVFDEDRKDVSFPDTMMRLHVDESKVLTRFLEVVLLSTRGRKHMMRSAAGTSGSMKKINRQTLGQCLIPTPPLAIQRKLLKKIDELRIVIDASDTVVESIRATKAALTNLVLA